MIDVQKVVDNLFILSANVSHAQFTDQYHPGYLGLRPSLRELKLHLTLGVSMKRGRGFEALKGCNLKQVRLPSEAGGPQTGALETGTVL